MTKLRFFWWRSKLTAVTVVADDESLTYGKQGPMGEALSTVCATRTNLGDEERDCQNVE